MSQSHIIGLIIAAGKGERLRQIASLKPLATVAGRPLIDWVLAGFESAGIRRIIVVTGFGADRLEHHLHDWQSQAAATIEIVRNPDFSRANGCSVLCARDMIEGRFILSMSDHIFDPEIVRRLIDQGDRAELTLAVDRRANNPDVDLDDVTKVRINGEAIAAIGKDILDYDAFDTGLFNASPSLFEVLKKEMLAHGDASLSGGVTRLASEGKARVLDIGERFWIDVDDAPALERAEQAIRALSEDGLLWA